MRFQWPRGQLDLDSRELFVDGARKTLSPKALSVLSFLLQASPRVVSKSELLERVWPDVYVSEGNLAVLIGEVRSAVGDSAKAPTFIKTHFGLGYSIVAQVVALPSGRMVPLPGPTATLRIGNRVVALLSGTLSVGRDEQCDVVVNDASVSRVHAKINVKGTRVEIEDRSKNGTFVSGIRIERATVLAPGDRVSFGTVETQFTIESPSTLSTRTISGQDEE